MKLELDGFRRYATPITVDLPAAGTCLLQGDSGCGKSTLFAAIAWALFGKEGGDPYSWTSKKKHCSVRLTLDDGVVVFRQKNPERLTVSLPTAPTPTVLTSRDEAQSLLQRRYGCTSAAWSAGTYLRQNQRNPLLEGSASDKVALFEALAFHDDPPSKYLDAAQTLRRDAARHVDRCTAVLQHTPPPVPPTPLDALTHAECLDTAYTPDRLPTESAVLRTMETQHVLSQERERLDEALARTAETLAAQHVGLWSPETVAALDTWIAAQAAAQSAESATEPWSDIDRALAQAFMDPSVRDAHRTAASVWDTLQSVFPSFDGTELPLYRRRAETVLAEWDAMETYASFRRRSEPPPTPLDPSTPPFSPAAVRDADRMQQRVAQRRAAASDLLRLPPIPLVDTDGNTADDTADDHTDEDALIKAAARRASVWSPIVPYLERYRSYVSADTEYERHRATATPNAGETMSSSGDDNSEPDHDRDRARAADLVASLRLSVQSHACPHCRLPVFWDAASRQLVAVTPAAAALTGVQDASSAASALKYAEAQLAWHTRASALYHTVVEREKTLADCPYDAETLDAFTDQHARAVHTFLALPPAPACSVSASEMVAHNTWLAYESDRQKWSAWHAALPLPYTELVDVQARVATKRAATTLVTSLDQLDRVWATCHASLPPSSSLGTQKVPLPLRQPDVARATSNAALLQRASTAQSDLDRATSRLTSLNTPCPLPPQSEWTPAAVAAQRERAAQVAALKETHERYRTQRDACPSPIDADALARQRQYVAELAWMPRFLDDTRRARDAAEAAAKAERAYQLTQHLVDKIKWVEHTVIQSFVNAFNAALEAVLGDVFDDPILLALRVALDPKPAVQWALTYKGTTDRSVSDLSGGEQDRVSLAITLALASTSSLFPAVMLDECFGSLDATSRARCLDTLRTHVPHKPVYIIAHGEVEGDYDTTLALPLTPTTD